MHRLIPVLLAVLLALPTLAQPAPTTWYQGYLEQNGAPVNDPAATLTFRLYRTANGGAPLWTETKSNVAITDGVFNVALGSQTPLVNTLFDGLLFLSTAVGGPSAPQLSPRVVFRAVPYARTLSAPARVTGAGASGGAVLQIENTSFTTGGGLHVDLDLQNPNYAIEASGGSGVFGVANTTSGIGVTGLGDSFGNSIGVYGYTFSSQGTGVQGLAASDESGSTGIGVYGQSASRNGTGVYAFAESEVGFANGVEAYTASTDGIAVYGWAYNFLDPNRVTRGVYGLTSAQRGYGVEGFAESTVGTPHGVHGYAPPNGYAGYFEGRAHVNGTLSKLGGSFEIDHPLDPENRVLRHSFVESPDMMNVYNGNATTDARGYATVALPDWFEALNRDFRYQLTTIGSFARATVAEEITGNRFVIRTEEPNVRVSWQVTGIRHDAWAEANRIVVEDHKPADQRGRYLAPAAFGQPEERGVDYDPGRAALRAHIETQRARAAEPPAPSERRTGEPPSRRDQ